ncbi:hypothetical protein SAMN05421539_103401 [Jannaschia seohaensis]|uniref:Uncharacterized protein n=1 Tax=Jannaschia seohaensis TaxID=475081 RepID=A0A2Y9AMV2_9RHOB|nr:hypothetical protein BCF38_103401 [Jannaschia seohaensis]SSA44678.1 hypothetical protein SAMN05421539_103401 [Jannaschia seohaensis]
MRVSQPVGHAARKGGARPFATVTCTFPPGAEVFRFQRIDDPLRDFVGGGDMHAERTPLDLVGIDAWVEVQLVDDVLSQLLAAGRALP